MSSISSPSFVTKCRVCLKVNHKKKLLPIFSPNKNVSSLLTNADLLMACSSIKILKTDGLPQNICNNCNDQLSQAYKFKSLCESSDKILRRQLKIEEPIAIINELIADENKSHNDNELETPKDKNENLNVQYICECSASFKNELFYFTHLNEQCRLRGKNKKLTNTDLEDDIELEAEDKTLKEEQTCKKCGKFFLLRGNYLRHIKTQVCRDERKYLCPECGLGFKVMYHFKDHINIHTGVKPYTCEFCNKSFVQKSSLRSHRVVHTKEKNFVCKLCGRAFAHKLSLRKHLVAHTDERKFACEICGKKFKSALCVKQHTRIMHTSTKSFKCEFCDKDFKFRRNLSAHRRIHTGEKPFVCEVCVQAFTRQCYLRLHRKSYHKE